MKKTNIHRHLGLLSETHRFKDPWAGLLTIEIYPEHHKPWQDWLLDQQKTNPAVVKAINAQISGPGTSPELDGEDIGRLMKNQDLMKEGLALHRIVTIEGLEEEEYDEKTGESLGEPEPVPYTPEVGLKLLRDIKSDIPSGEPHGPNLLGDAITELIIEKGGKLELFRADQEKVAEGNS